MTKENLTLGSYIQIIEFYSKANYAIEFVLYILNHKIRFIELKLDKKMSEHFHLHNNR